MLVNDLGTNGAITNGDLGEVDRWVRHTEVCLHDVRLSEDVSVNIRGGSAEARTIYIPA